MNESNDAVAELLTLTLTVDQWGDRIYRNSVGLLHRIHGPALECANGAKYWYLNGQLHRTTGPAVEWANGGYDWYQNGLRHRVWGPAYVRANERYWYLNGEQFTEKEFHERLK